MTKHLRFLGAITFSLFVLSACGSSDDDTGGSGGSGGAVFEPVADAVCARKVAGGCDAQSSSCAEELIEEHAVAAVFGCTAEHTAYTECLGNNDWMCEPSGGGTMIHEPDECADLKQGFESCAPVCGHSIVGGIGGDQCDMQCWFDNVEIEVSCPSGPTSCSCTKGPKTGTAVQLDECDRAKLAAALLADCS
jgi:hypothetical protein